MRACRRPSAGCRWRRARTHSPQGVAKAKSEQDRRHRIVGDAGRRGLAIAQTFLAWPGGRQPLSFWPGPAGGSPPRTRFDSRSNRVAIPIDDKRRCLAAGHRERQPVRLFLGRVAPDRLARRAATAPMSGLVVLVLCPFARAGASQRATARDEGCESDGFLDHGSDLFNAPNAKIVSV